MALLLGKRNTDKDSREESSSASLTSSRSLLKLETINNEDNTFWNMMSQTPVSAFQDPQAQRQSIHNVKQSKDRTHRRCSSSSRTEQSSYADSPIPAFVYIPCAFSPSYYHNNDETSSSSSSTEEELEISNLSQDFHHWQAFQNMSDIKHNAAWGITLATVNDIIGDEKIQMVCPQMEFLTSAEGSPKRQPKPPLSHCSLSTSSLLVV